jgi:glycogen debranching enzyme
VARYDLPARTGDVWHGLLSARLAGPGTHYAFVAHGPNEPENGHRFDPAVMLLDPCARELSALEPKRSRVIDGAFDWNGDRPPATPWRDTVIYELHVKGYTQLHPDVPEGWRGKYLGLDRAGGDRALEAYRRDGGRAPALPSLRERGVFCARAN